MREGLTYGASDIGFGFNAYIYTWLYDAIVSKSARLARYIPDFVIEESLQYFAKKEQYEKCSVIKQFFDSNPKRMFHMSRNDWMNYGWSAARA